MTCSFGNSVRNIGSQFIQDLAGEKHHAQMEEMVMTALRAQFKPEFLNRVDNVVIFHSLDREHIGRIVGIQMGRLNKLLAQRGLSLSLSQAALDFLASAGFDPVYGARPL